MAQFANEPEVYCRWTTSDTQCECVEHIRRSRKTVYKPRKDLISQAQGSTGNFSCLFLTQST